MLTLKQTYSKNSSLLFYPLLVYLISVSFTFRVNERPGFPNNFMFNLRLFNHNDFYLNALYFYTHFIAYTFHNKTESLIVVCSFNIWTLIKMAKAISWTEKYWKQSMFIYISALKNRILIFIYRKITTFGSHYYILFFMFYTYIYNK